MHFENPTAKKFLQFQLLTAKKFLFLSGSKCKRPTRRHKKLPACRCKKKFLHVHSFGAVLYSVENSHGISVIHMYMYAYEKKVPSFSSHPKVSRLWHPGASRAQPSK